MLRLRQYKEADAETIAFLNLDVGAIYLTYLLCRISVDDIINLILMFFRWR